MKRASKKSNLSIVRDYLNGERPFIQVGYDESTSITNRKEGEEWEDSNGVKWVKKNGYKRRISKKAKYILEQKCSVCRADMKWGDRLDQKIYPKTGRCYNCNIEFEAVLKEKGLYTNYENFKIHNNELSILKDFKNKVVDSINYLENSTPTSKNPQFFNDDGSNEIWIDDTDRRQIILQHLKEDLEKVNKDISIVEEALLKNNYDPTIESKIIKFTTKKLKNKNKI